MQHDALKIHKYVIQASWGKKGNLHLLNMMTLMIFKVAEQIFVWCLYSKTHWADIEEKQPFKQSAVPRTDTDAQLAACV